ncbi:energy transducer TonB [Pararcticibacter amylolyticus]|uniref:TonB C-terminal domain-containing protein n=1 Tax=Pararcticibacter amylolyticus TaxID=2173175 RepID=A0A2U2PIW3_9SPHI|nr:energy transducer TonB [Pararcticibacter amylolyticus]PWG81099.1 hypothetical protein DDR33_09240 [Pararcticibacter amylolyticus]
MKKLLILCLLLNTATFAQKKQNIYFLKNDGRKVPVKDSADFIRIIEEPDSGSVFFNVSEFYPDNQKKLTGHASQVEPLLIYEGLIKSFYPDGKTQEVSYYEKGELIGRSDSYYKNGQLKETKEYLRETESGRLAENKYKPQKYKLLTYFDSTGTQTVKDGNGYAKYFDAQTDISEEGQYLNGFKNGTWKGKSGNNFFEENYQQGTFTEGIATLSDGSKSTYKDPDQFPDYKGGIPKFYEYVSKSYRFPKEAREYGVSGRLILSFIVEKSGELSNVKIVRNLGYGTGEKAVEMLERSPKWIPGKQHGIPVRVTYTLPIMLNLAPEPASRTPYPFGKSRSLRTY